MSNYIDKIVDPKTGIEYSLGEDPVTKTYVDTGLAGKANVYTVEDIKALTSEMCDSLLCGDIVSKEDSTGKHAYVVTFKKDNVGLCLTYADGSGYIETVSYDYVTDAWVYNSTDVFNGGTKLYKHSFSLDSIDIRIITNIQTPLESVSDINALLTNNNVVSAFVNKGGSDFTLLTMKEEAADIVLAYYDFNDYEMRTATVSGEFTDTVTEL